MSQRKGDDSKSWKSTFIAFITPFLPNILVAKGKFVALFGLIVTLFVTLLWPPASSLLKLTLAKIFTVPTSQFLGQFNFTNDQIENIDAYISEIVATIIYVIITIAIALGVYLLKRGEQIWRAIDGVRDVAEGNNTKIDGLKNHLEGGKKYQETIQVAVFSRLLAYSPLYAADFFHYFKEEGLKVEIVDAAGDDEVANKIREGTCFFGVCDPVFVLEDNHSEDREQLKILIPVAKKLDITVVCSKDVFKEKKDRVTIISYSQPSTTYSAAVKLKEDLEQLCYFKNIEIFQVEPNNSAFNSPDHLRKFMLQQHGDFVMLWNPMTSWFFGGSSINNFSKYGRLVCNSNKPGANDMDHWSTVSFDENINQKCQYLWHPNGAQGTGHQVLASALLASNYTLKNRNELCKKMFRALSRALIRIEGVKWSEERYEQGFEEEIKKNLQHPQSQYFLPGTLKRMVSGTESAGGSIFPFIPGVKEYSPRNYLNHLTNLRDLWNNDQEMKGRLVSPPSLGDVEKYFFEPGKT